nr:restriction endonuclease subunit S [Thermus sp. CCB_US3_UF1]
MTELGPLPEEWQVVRLGEVGKVITGRTPPTSQARFWNGHIPFITPVDLQGKPIRHSERSITEEGLQHAKPLPRGAVLVSCIGYIGKIGIVEAELATTNQQINAVIPFGCDNWFLAYALMHETDVLRSRARMTTVPILHKSNFENIPIPFPPLTEQRAIAHVLRTVQAAKEAGERVVEALRALKKSLMRHLFTYGPVPIDAAEHVPLRDTELGPLPAHWQVVRLGEVAEVKYGRAKPKAEGEIPVIGSGGIYGWADAPLVEFPTLVIGRKGTAGQVWLVEQACWPSDTTYYLIWKKPVDVWFVFGFVSLNPLSGEHARTTLPSLKRHDLENYLIPLPPLPEQREIARMLQAVDQRIQAEEAHVHALEALFRTLLHELMTARRRLPAEFIAKFASHGDQTLRAATPTIEERSL